MEWNRLMRAIVDIKGKQYEVEEGRYVQIDRYHAGENEEVLLNNVRMILAGEQSLIGKPFVDGASVKTRIKRHGRGPKILVYKMRCKKGYRRKNGHRQDFTELQVEWLDFPGRDEIAPRFEELKPEEKVEKPDFSPAAAVIPDGSEDVQEVAAMETTTPEVSIPEEAHIETAQPEAVESLEMNSDINTNTETSAAPELLEVQEDGNLPETAQPEAVEPLEMNSDINTNTETSAAPELSEVQDDGNPPETSQPEAVEPLEMNSDINTNTEISAAPELLEVQEDGNPPENKV